MAFYFFNGTNEQPNTAILLSIEKEIQKLCFVQLGELMYVYQSVHYCIGNPRVSKFQPRAFSLLVEVYFFNGTNDQQKTATLLSIENDIQMVCYAELGEIMYVYHSLHYCIGNPVWSNTQTLKFCSRVAQRKRAGPITQRSIDRNHPLLLESL